MTQHRVVAPVIPAGEKPKGPASYFAGIEAKHGKPIQHWLDIAADALDTRTHMETVVLLKDEHGLGHGHANAVVAYVKAKLAG
jgi:hypothetical protein